MAGVIQRHLRQQRSFRSIEEEVFVGLQLVADRVMAPWAGYLREAADLTPVQYNVLRILRGAGQEGLWAGEVAERMVARSPDMTRLLDRLERRGLVRRTRDPHDRRAVRVRITAAGRDQLAGLDDVAKRRLGSAFGDLDRARLESLRDTLEAILESTEPAP